MFIETPFITARTGELPRWSVYRRRDKGVMRTHSGILLSYRKECVGLRSNKVDERRGLVVQGEVSQEKKHKSHMLALIHVGI